jgi:hypothetical protein
MPVFSICEGEGVPGIQSPLAGRPFANDLQK